MLSNLGITPRKFSFEPTQTFFWKVQAIQKCCRNSYSRRCHLQPFWADKATWVLEYLDDLLNIDNPYFESMVNRIYPPELQLNKANTSDTEAPFLDLHLSILSGFVSSKIYDKPDVFDFDIVNFPFLDGDVPRSTSYGVNISQLIRFARVHYRNVSVFVR